MEIHSPRLSLRGLISLCDERLQTELQSIAKEQTRLDEYRENNPDKVLQVNSRQDAINRRYDNIEYLCEAILEVIPAIFEAESNRAFIKGSQSQKGHESPYVTNYLSEHEKESIREYSIARQRLLDNI